MRCTACLTLITLFIGTWVMTDVALARSGLVNALRHTEQNLCVALKAKGCATHKPKKKQAGPVIAKRQKQGPPVAVPIAHVPIKKEFVPPEPKAAPIEQRTAVPVPKLKPIEPTVPERPAAQEARKAPIPIPKLMPDMPSPPQVAIAPRIVPPPAKPPQLPPALPSPAVVPAPQQSFCAAELAKYNVEYTNNAKYEQFGFCEISDPVQLSSMMLAGAKVTFPDRPIVGCSYAAQLAKFITDEAGPITAAQTSSKIAKFYTGPGFVCRGRNGDSSAKLSEHAKGDAVDVERIVLSDGVALEIKDAGSTDTPHYGVLNAMRHAACGYFSTVLGPGSNEAHKNHFHLDMEVRGKAGTYRICE